MNFSVTLPDQISSPEEFRSKMKPGMQFWVTTVNCGEPDTCYGPLTFDGYTTVTYESGGKPISYTAIIAYYRGTMRDQSALDDTFNHPTKRVFLSEASAREFLRLAKEAFASDPAWIAEVRSEQYFARMIDDEIDRMYADEYDDYGDLHERY